MRKNYVTGIFKNHKISEQTSNDLEQMWYTLPYGTLSKKLEMYYDIKTNISN